MSISKVYVQLNGHTVTFMSFPNLKSDITYVDGIEYTYAVARRMYNELRSRGYTLTNSAPKKVRTRPYMSPKEIYDNGKMLFR